MRDVVDRVFRIVLDPEDADTMVGQVAVGVERDVALQRLQFGCLNRVAHGVAGDRLPDLTQRRLRPMRPARRRRR